MTAKRTSPTCAGVDGCRGGWVIATRAAVTIATRIDDVIAMPFAVIAIDMPIGLPDTEARRCEPAARRYLSSRASTIFSTPSRDCLDAADYADACARSFAQRGVKISQQSWRLLPKIAELDDALDADDAQRVVEAHPECTLAMLNGDVPLPSKHTADGIARRVALLGRHLGFNPFGVPVTPSPQVTGVRASADDILDAFAVLLTAERFAAGAHHVLPADDPQWDRRGLPMRIVI